MIEQNVPLPRRPYKGGKKSRYPFRAMQIGDSMFTETAPSVSYWQIITGFKFAVRSVTENGVDGFRVWRTDNTNEG